jgi:hypothetical protein
MSHLHRCFIFYKEAIAMKLTVGDWVQASYYGNVIFGYIETVYVQDHSYTIHVLRNFHRNPKLTIATVDETKIIKKYKIDLLPEDIRCLIELALATKDEEWFMQLTKSYRKKVHGK